MTDVINHARIEKIAPAQASDRANDNAGAIAVDSWKERESATKIKPLENENNLKCLSFKDDVYQTKCGPRSTIESKPEALDPDHGSGSLDKPGKKIPHDGGPKDFGPLEKLPQDGGPKDFGPLEKLPLDGCPKDKLPASPDEKELKETYKPKFEDNLPKASGY